MFSYLLVWIQELVCFLLGSRGLTVEILRKRNLTLVDVASAHGSAKENLWTTCFMFYITVPVVTYVVWIFQTGFMP